FFRVDPAVGEAARQLPPCPLVYALFALADGLVCDCTEALVVECGTRRPDDSQLRIPQSVTFEIIERGQQHAAREIARRAKNHQRVCSSFHPKRLATKRVAALYVQLTRIN